MHKLFMTEVSTNLRNIFFPKISPILELEVGFFSDKKSFSQILENTPNFFHPKFISKKKKKIRETFLSGHSLTHSLTHSLITTRFARGSFKTVASQLMGHGFCTHFSLSLSFSFSFSFSFALSLYIYVYMYIYIYVYRERERKRERDIPLQIDNLTNELVYK